MTKYADFWRSAEPNRDLDLKIINGPSTNREGVFHWSLGRQGLFHKEFRLILRLISRVESHRYKTYKWTLTFCETKPNWTRLVRCLIIWGGISTWRILLPLYLRVQAVLLYNTNRLMAISENEQVLLPIESWNVNDLDATLDISFDIWPFPMCDDIIMLLTYKLYRKYCNVEDRVFNGEKDIH